MGYEQGIGHMGCCWGFGRDKARKYHAYGDRKQLFNLSPIDVAHGFIQQTGRPQGTHDTSISLVGRGQPLVHGLLDKGEGAARLSIKNSHKESGGTVGIQCSRLGDVCEIEIGELIVTLTSLLVSGGKVEVWEKTEIHGNGKTTEDSWKGGEFYS